MGSAFFFFVLQPIHKIALTWNMLFGFARKHVIFDFYYQVNDDLNIITPGWLTKFINALRLKNFIGVAGPSDNSYGFPCALLSQAFVSEKHFKIFDGQFYPLEFQDWKSDRWLSFVYGPERTFCRSDIIANNGAKKTRYDGCQLLDWKLLLEKGKKILSNALETDFKIQ